MSGTGTMFFVGITIGAGSLVAILALAVLVWYVRRRSKENPTSPLPKVLLDEMQRDKQLRRWLVSGEKISATWRLHELTQMGLKEAKDAVDSYFEHRDAMRKPAPKKAPPNIISDQGLRRLIEQGKIEEAVETYRLFTGVDVYTARDVVNQLRRDQS